MGVVIVGGGQGGFQAAVSLRAEGYQERIVVIGDEVHIPYQRPPLSKGFLLGKQEVRHATLRPAPFFEAQKIELISGKRVTSIDRAARRVSFDGDHIEYDYLVLATGARNRVLQNIDALYLRSLDEATELRRRLADANDVVVIGGGFIGLEVAAAARTLGKKVTVLETQPRLMARVLAPVLSEYFLQRHSEQGAQIVLNASADEIAKRKGDLVVAGIGVVPNIELAREAGLPIANGIVVNEHLRTADERIFAIGDCAEYPNPFANARVRLESVQNAVDQAASVAKSITGHVAPYESAPWFWTDQYDIHMQMVGLSHGFDQTVTKGDREAGKFSVYYFRGGRLIGVDSINQAARHLAARKLIASRSLVGPEDVAGL